MKGCLKTVVVVVVGFLILAIVIAGISFVSNDSIDKTEAKDRSSQRKEIEKRQIEPQAKRVIDSVPLYEVVAVNPNGHKIFIVTQTSTEEGLISIVTNYQERYKTPVSPWMINFFSDKQKALRVQKEWLVPATVDSYDEQWVYNENIDHSGIGQWTSWDGLTLDKW